MAVKIGRSSAANATKTLALGAEAPEIALKTHNNEDFKLSDLRGRKNALLAFYPLAFTPT